MQATDYMKGPTLSNDAARRVVQARQQGRDSRILESDLTYVGGGQPWKRDSADRVVAMLSRI